jgi:hypothetical protein
MKRTLGYMLTASFVLITVDAALAAPADTEQMIGVTIRIWDRAQIGTNVWDHTKTAVERVFMPAGIQLIWSYCTIDDTPQSLACSAPTGPNDISLRVYERSRTDVETKGHARGGTSMLLSPVGGKGIVHVFFDRVTEVSATCKVPVELVLGITVAHEIGHLLLPGQAHVLAGIMRAKLDTRDWRLAAQGSLGFTQRQRQSIAAGVQARSLKITAEDLDSVIHSGRVGTVRS